MPLYDCKCASGHLFERQIPLSEFEAPIICACGQPANRCISKPTIFGGRVDYEYSCPITGKPITTKRAHEENLKVHGCRVLESGERDYNARLQASRDDELDRKIETTVERTVATMPSEKRERLASELAGGLDVQVERK